MLLDEPIAEEALPLVEGLAEPLLPAPTFAIGAVPVPVEEVGPTPRVEFVDVPLVVPFDDNGFGP